MPQERLPDTEEGKEEVIGYRARIYHCENPMNEGSDMEVYSAEGVTPEGVAVTGTRMLGNHLHTHSLMRTIPCYIAADPVYRVVEDNTNEDGYRLERTEVLVPIPTGPIAPSRGPEVDMNALWWD